MKKERLEMDKRLKSMGRDLKMQQRIDYFKSLRNVPSEELSKRLEQKHQQLKDAGKNND